ncbi:hypothetical protein [Mycobacterium sp. 1245111.1]|uniref:hypothetical protein n=1 Tax=Mycobacterium sp. 1245111.1 TaxID=1834073 RepID=UPI0012EB01B6|nr:hypothetical protein [Mycobacterium sp. 1245111.1]
MNPGPQDRDADGAGALNPREAGFDVLPPVGSLTLTQAADLIAAAPTDKVRLRLFFEFCRGADEAGAAAMALAGCEPPSTGSARFDALLAAIAEHLASRVGVAAPEWAEGPDRFLTTPWWVSPLPSARAQALRGTPTSFRRRGIYLDRSDLGQDGVTALGD